MTRREQLRDPRGFFGIGICHGKTKANLGTLWRSADLLGAAFVFTVGARYKQQSSDTTKAWRHVPLHHYETVDDLVRHLPHSCPLVGIELDERAIELSGFSHPERAAYLLGAEDHGLTKDEIAACHSLVQLPGRYSMNVAAAGTVVMYDRHVKRGVSSARRVA